MKNKLKGKKILFACVPVDGHFNPLTGLAKYLQDNGCDVRWYTSEIYTEKLRKLDIPRYPYVNALDINGLNFLEMVPELKTDDMVRKSFLYQKNLFAGRAEEYDEDIREIAKSFPFDVFIADVGFSAIPLVKHHLKVPVVAVGVVPLTEESVDVAPYRTGLPPAEDETTRTLYARMHEEHRLKYKEHLEVFTDILDKYNIPYPNTSFQDILVKSADLYLQIGTPGFEYKRSDLGSNIRFVGALMPYTEQKITESWFDSRLYEYRKVVLATQGTIESDVTKILEPTLQAFQHVPDVLVIITTGGHGTAELRAKYTAKNLIIEDFIPFRDVMPYADVYVSNGGYGGVILSLTNKLPVVAAGLHEGKIEICARLDYFRYGINLKTEKPTAEAIYKAASQIMQDPTYKENVTRLCHEFERYEPCSLSAGFIAELLEKHTGINH